MTTQCKGMNSTVHLSNFTLMWIIAFILLFFFFSFSCSGHILSPSAAVCVKHELHFKSVHQKQEQSNMELLMYLATNYDVYVN